MLNKLTGTCCASVEVIPVSVSSLQENNPLLLQIPELIFGVQKVGPLPGDLIIPGDNDWLVWLWLWLSLLLSLEIILQALLEVVELVNVLQVAIDQEFDVEF